MERILRSVQIEDTTTRAVRPKVLFVPGFVVDVYSEIERQYVELCAKSDATIEFLWLVPDIDSPCNNFAKAHSRATLREPVWAQHLRSSGIPYVVVRISKYNVVTNFLLFRRIFREHQIDAVYTHFGFERFWAVFFAKLFGKTTLWNEHWHSLGTRYTGAKRIFYRLFVDHFIAVSRFIADTLPKNARVHVMRNAIGADKFHRSTDEEQQRKRAQLSLPEQRKVVLLVSAFRENKRHDLAVPICERVLRARADVLFVFLGEGPLRSAVTERVKRLGLAEKILFPGHVDGVDDYYLAADICMLTSIGEPCALAIFESMKYALPLVAFESGGTPEIVKHEETGVLVPDSDVDRFSVALLDLLENDEKRIRLGTRALDFVRAEADRDAWISRLRALVRDLVSGENRKWGYKQ